MKRHERCRIGGSLGAGEIPLLSSFLYLFDEAELDLKAHLVDSRPSLRGDPSRRQCQVGSLAWAAHLSNDNAGVLSENGNLTWNKRVKAGLILIFSMNTNCESMAYRSFSL